MEEYTYSPLKSGQFRLLHILPVQNGNEELIECSLSHHDFNTNLQVPYIALSYTWGDTSGGRDILIEGKRMYARPNLYACLCSLRHHDLSQYVWIDAICINQRDEDDDEKSAQIKLMDQIYSKAENVAVCLRADNDDNVSTFFDTVEHYRRHYDQNNFPTPQQDQHKIYQAVQWLCHNPYFSRMWIVQENILAANRTLICGTRQIPWLYVERMVAESEFTVPDEFSQEKHSQLIRGSGFEHISGLTPHHLKAKQEPPAPTLFNALVRYQQQQCFDRRDKVFALLGLPDMQKPKIQNVCDADYKKDVQDLLLDILEWFEASPNLAARHQTQLQRYGLLQGTLGHVEQSIKSCRLVNIDNLSSLADYQFSVEFASGRVSQLPIVITEASYKGQITSFAVFENMEDVLEEAGDGQGGKIRERNLRLLEQLQCSLKPEQVIFGFRGGSEGNALGFFRRHSSDKGPTIQSRQSLAKVELPGGGWGIANAGVAVGDLVYTVIVGQTQNNTGICCSLILRENSERVFSAVSLALDHLGFESINRQRPSQALVAPMPPRANKGDRQRNLQLAMDPEIAFKTTSLAGLKTLGYGWRTLHKMAW
ncbi:heterokaryon incompatibility protein-domain-containing protein [Hypoxylon sp. NC0597]|nr:heterokaryon incompatibility protein-domain-containing protein [Hypoxylon sp. NC0597]